MVERRLPPRVRLVVDVTREVAREFSRDRVTDNAAGVTFYMVFAIPAAALALTAFLGLLEPVFGTDLRDDARDTVVDYVRDEISANPDLVDAVGALFDQRGAGLFTFAIVLALFTMSRGFAGLVRALDAVYDLDEHRSFVNVRATALVLSVGTVVMGSLALAAFTVGPLFGLGEEIADAIGAGDGFVRLWDLLRLPTMLVVLVVWAATVFHVGPDHHTPWRYDLPGAILTASAWILLSFGFGLYVRLTEGGNEVVGLLSTVLVALTWLFFMITALLVGGQLNAVIAQRAGVSEQRDGPSILARAAAVARQRLADDDADGGASALVAWRIDRLARPGGTMDLHLAVPAAGTGEGLVLLPEVFGIDERTRLVAERATREGFVVAVPDVFWRTAPGHAIDPAEPGALEDALEIAREYDPEAGLADIRAVLGHLRAMPEVTGRTGVIGIRFGGTIALRTAIELDPDCAAVQLGAGSPAFDLLDRADEIACPVLLRVGGDGLAVRRHDREHIEAAAATRPGWEVVFTDRTLDDPDHDDSWSLAVEFLDRSLRG